MACERTFYVYLQNKHFFPIYKQTHVKLFVECSEIWAFFLFQNTFSMRLNIDSVFKRNDIEFFSHVNYILLFIISHFNEKSCSKIVLSLNFYLKFDFKNKFERVTQIAIVPNFSYTNNLPFNKYELKLFHFKPVGIIARKRQNLFTIAQVIRYWKFRLKINIVSASLIKKTKEKGNK